MRGSDTRARPAVHLGLMVLALVLFYQRPDAQSYSSGQNVWPAFEGWERNADGSSTFLFGYMNDNWEEELDLPIGPENSIEPGSADQGQPTHFLPRRNRFVFRVRVPNGFGDREMVWTLTAHGKTGKAYATLRPDSLIDNVDIMSETGALEAGFSTPEFRGDQPPTVRLEGATARSTRVGQPITLTALVADDGIPRTRTPPAGGERGRGAAPRAPSARDRNPGFNPPVQVTVGKALGLHVSWFVYRGAGQVTFEPNQVKAWEDTRVGANSPWAPLWRPPPVPPEGRYVVQATFEQPGIYVLRARADDGALFSDQDVTVTVTR